MKLLSFFSPIMPHRLVYMLQQVEYDFRKFLSWIVGCPNLARVMRRKKLVYTRKAQALLMISYGVLGLDIAIVALLIVDEKWLLASSVFLLAPVLVIVALTMTVVVGNKFLYVVRRPLLGQAKRQLENHKAIKIAVLGSYGKTSMKEMLLSVLGEGKRVKATPGNMNVPISHARWITKRVGADEEVLIFEYGEGEPGDIAKFAELTSPSWGVITGIAPNHLDRYPSMEALSDDLLSIRRFLPDEKLLLNGSAAMLHEKAGSIPTFSEAGVKGWTVEDIEIDYEGTSFSMKRKGEVLQLRSQLLGRHHVGPLAAVVSIADELGLSPEQIKSGVAMTKPFEHRMEARSLHGAWIIDDTYNGNLEGIRAGLRLMNDLPAKRRVYVTPGLVDQGIETENVHRQIGELIAKANPARVVLMDNSVTSFIQAGLKAAGFNGEVSVEQDPVDFYTNIEHTVAAGDLVVMQNDWTDNYL